MATEHDNDDLLADLLMEKPQEEDDEVQFDPKETKAFRDQISQLERENKGLLKGVQEERRKRQELKGRLDQVTTTVNSILETRQNLGQTSSEEAASKLKGIPVEFTEEGDAYVPSDKLETLTSKYEEEIAALKEELNATRATSSAEREYENVVQSILGEKEEYTPSYQKYRSARKWVEDAVVDWSVQNNVNTTISSGQALDYVFSDEQIAGEFAQRFPGMDLASVVQAQDSTWHFRRMLDSVAGTLQSLHDAPKDGRFQRVMNKPSSLGRTANAKGGEPDLVQRVGSLSATDLLKLTDEQVAALEKFMLNEEQSDGISF